MTLTWGTENRYSASTDCKHIINDEVTDSSVNIKSSQCKILHRDF